MTTNDAHIRIMSLLRDKHREDIADREVLIGSSGQRMDFWAAACSWAHPTVIGYEVKVSRQDFIRDNKWPAYLDHCRQLYFVTAPGIVQLGEIPEQCGWIELSKNGARLMTRKKAPARPMDPKHEARIFKVILMRKSGIVFEDPKEFWTRWLEKRREEREIGRVLRYEIAATIADKLAASARESKRLEERCARAEIIEQTMQRMGLNPANLHGSWAVERELRKAVETQASGPIAKAIDEIAKTATKLRADLQKIECLASRFKDDVEKSLSTSQVAPVFGGQEMIQSSPVTH